MEIAEEVSKIFIETSCPDFTRFLYPDKRLQKFLKEHGFGWRSRRKFKKWVKEELGEVWWEVLQRLNPVFLLPALDVAYTQRKFSLLSFEDEVIKNAKKPVGYLEDPEGLMKILYSDLSRSLNAKLKVLRFLVDKNLLSPHLDLNFKALLETYLANDLTLLQRIREALLAESRMERRIGLERIKQRALKLRCVYLATFMDYACWLEDEAGSEISFTPSGSLLLGREEKMFKRIAEVIEEKPCLIMVGCLHIPYLLEKLGKSYEVEGYR